MYSALYILSAGWVTVVFVISSWSGGSSVFCSCGRITAVVAFGKTIGGSSAACIGVEASVYGRRAASIRFSIISGSIGVCTKN